MDYSPSSALYSKAFFSLNSVFLTILIHDLESCGVPPSVYFLLSVGNPFASKSDVLLSVSTFSLNMSIFFYYFFLQQGHNTTLIITIMTKIKAEKPIIKDKSDDFSSSLSNDSPFAGRKLIYVISYEFSIS